MTTPDQLPFVSVAALRGTLRNVDPRYGIMRVFQCFAISEPNDLVGDGPFKVLDGGDSEVKKIHIGYVSVFSDTPRDGNPFKESAVAFRNYNNEPNCYVSGNARVAALTAFAQDKDIGSYQFWSTKQGNVYRITDPDDIDWETSRIERIKAKEEPCPRPTTNTSR